MPFRAIISKRIISRNCVRHFSSSPFDYASKASFEKIQTNLKQQFDVYLVKLTRVSDNLKRLSSEVNNSQEALKKASNTLNEITGYNHIETVKEKVTRQSALFETTRQDVQIAKKEYQSAIETRSSTQRNINELLQRKHLWTADDVTHFTELYRLEHSHTQAESISKEKYQACEKQMDREYMELARSIMERYHEEQLWSDKIRSASTYGTWALMGVNLLLFVAVQTVFEPRKRKRLTDRFEELLVSKVDEEEEKFKHVFESLDEKDRVLMEHQVLLMDAVNNLSEHPLFDQTFLDSIKQIPERTKSVAVPEEITKTPEIVLDDHDLLTLLMTPTESPPTLPNPLWNTVQSAIAGGLVTAVAIYFLN